MGFFKSLLSLFGKSESAAAPTLQQAMPPDDDDDDEEMDRTTVMTGRQFKDVTKHIGNPNGGKK